MPRDDEQDERDRRDPPKRPGRSEWMDDEDARPRATFPVWVMIVAGLATLMVVGGLVAGVVVYLLSAQP